MPRRASLPEGKSLFFRRAPEAPETDGGDAAPLPAEQTDEPSLEPMQTAIVPVSKGQTRQSAIFLEERHLDWLEDKCREARQRGGKAIRKAVIIRALLDVAMESPVDLTSLRREDEIIERVRRGMRGS